MKIDLEDARSPQCLLFECVSGSKAYGTDTADSDTDLRGVFVMPKHCFYGLGELDQVSDASHDEVYYEVGRFVELLTKNNPNLMEMLFAMPEKVRHRHPLFARFQPEIFLSKRCEATFAGYAMAQIRKARGLNKKIVNPIERERKNLLHFCHVLAGQGSVPLMSWLQEHGIRQEDCGLVQVPHMRDVYGIYVGEPGYRGILTDPDSTLVACSSVTREAVPVGWMHVNGDGFKKYCRDYREYWDWVEHRNDARYQTNVAHGRNYDSKNLMHTFRLLEMARQIAEEGTITLHSPLSTWLLRVRAGDFEYDKLVRLAEERIAQIAEAFAKSDLQEEPDEDAANAALVEVREQFYEG